MGTIIPNTCSARDTEYTAKLLLSLREEVLVKADAETLSEAKGEAIDNQWLCSLIHSPADRGDSCSD